MPKIPEEDHVSNTHIESHRKYIAFLFILLRLFAEFVAIS